MKVLLISANTLQEPYPVYPLGLDYVAGAIQDRHRVIIADLNLQTTMEALPGLLSRENPDIIGISIRNIDNTDTTDPLGFTHQYQRLAALINEHSNAPIVLGGSGFSIFPRELMALLDADFGIAGEGEQMAKLLEQLETDTNPIPGSKTDWNTETIPGLLVKHSLKEAPGFPGKTHPLERRFTRAFSGQAPHVDFYLNQGGMLNLQTKRGCPFTCIYCTYPLIEGRRPRLFNPDEVAETALALEESGAGYLFITDSAFNADIGHSLAVAEAFKKQGLSIPWGAYFTPVKLPEGYFETLKQAGLTHVEFGTESLCDSVLKAYGKPFAQTHAVKSHRKAVRAGLHVAHFMLLGGPGETPKTLDKTLARLNDLKKSVIFFYLGMRIYPGTSLRRLAIRSGQITQNRSLLEPVFYRCPSFETGAIMKKIELEASTRPNWIIGTGGEATARSLAALYKRGFSGPLWEYLIR